MNWDVCNLLYPTLKTQTIRHLTHSITHLDMTQEILSRPATKR